MTVIHPAAIATTKWQDRSLPLTIAIPTYNRCQSLVTLIQQLLPQLQPDDELLVVNDGSQDDTEVVLSRLPQVRLISHATNSGLVRTWNDCLELASQDWICIIHDDDRIMPDALQTIRRACRLAQEPTLVAHAADTALDSCFRYRFAEPGPWSVLHTTTNPSGVTIHRAIVEDLGGFDAQFTYSCDLEYFARIAAHYSTLVVESPAILHYNQHDQNYQYKTWRQPDFWSQLVAIEQTILQYAALNGTTASQIFRDRMSAYAGHMLKHASKASDPTLLKHVGAVLWSQSNLGRKVRLTAGIAAVCNTLVEL